jgi:3-dehydroquinate synthase class II
MGTTGAKQIVYRYNGDANSEEVEQDLDGELAFQQDQIILRKGKDWKIIHISNEIASSGQGPVPVVRLFLTDQFA